MWTRVMGKGQSMKLQWRQCLLVGLPGARGFAGWHSLPPPRKAAALARCPAGRSPLRWHCSSTRGCGGSCGALGGLRVSLNHSVMLVWSAQYPALPSHLHPKFGGTLTGEIWLSVNRGGSLGFFSSSGSYSISAPQWAGYFCNSGEDNVLRIYHVFLKTL